MAAVLRAGSDIRSNTMLYSGKRYCVLLVNGAIWYWDSGALRSVKTPATWVRGGVST